MPIYNLLQQCSENYSKTSGSVWNYSIDKVNDSAKENNDSTNYRINKNKITTSKYFKYETKIIKRTLKDNNILDEEVFVSSKYLSNFWRSLDLTIINCKIELDLKLTKNCVKSEIS